MKHYFIHFQGEFNDSLMYSAVDQLEGIRQEAEKINKESTEDTYQSREQRKAKVTILFNSSGGLMSVGFGLYDYLQEFEKDMERYGWSVEARAVGIVGSACLYAYLGISRRSSFPNTQFLLHPSSVPAPGDPFMDRARLENLTNRLEKGTIIGSRILEERTKLSKAMIQYFIGKDRSGESIIFVPEAVEFGIVTETP